VGFQAREHSLQVRDSLQLFPGALGISYMAMRLHVQPIVESLEGKWGSQETVEKRRGTLPRVGQVCGE
jgi:hypothetical protein